jgi:hypothetical protein
VRSSAIQAALVLQRPARQAASMQLQVIACSFKRSQFQGSSGVIPEQLAACHPER